MKLAKIMLMSSMLLVPTMAMGIAQQEQDPATGQQLQQDQQWQQEHQMALGGDIVGVIVERRDDSFSVRTHDQGVVWFAITPELERQSSSELVTGNRVTVSSEEGDSPDMRNATSVTREDQMAQTDPTAAETDREFEDTDARIAQIDTEREFEDTSVQFDTSEERDQLPRTATSLPAIGSLGLLALIGAAVVAIARRF